MKISLFLSILSLFILGACNDDLIIDANYKDITIVYGLLNPQDNIQYIKISKAFLNKNSDALLIAQNIDSLYYKDTLIVAIKEYKNGSYQRSIYLSKKLISTKDSGTFSYPDEYIYYTPSVHLDPDATDSLIIINPRSGKMIKSSTTLVGAMTPLNPQSKTTITFDTSTSSDNKYNISWLTGKNAYFYDLTITFNYDEYPKASPSHVTEKSVVWPVFSYMLTNTLSANVRMVYSVKGYTFFQLIASKIPVDNSLNREFDNIIFTFSSGGKDIYYYINVNQPSTGTVQKKPEYTNIDNGYGIFSSRHIYSDTCGISPITRSEIKASPLTYKLNFVN